MKLCRRTVRHAKQKLNCAYVALLLSHTNCRITRRRLIQCYRPNPSHQLRFLVTQALSVTASMEDLLWGLDSKQQRAVVRGTDAEMCIGFDERARTSFSSGWRLWRRLYGNQRRLSMPNVCSMESVCRKSETRRRRISWRGGTRTTLVSRSRILVPSEKLKTA